MSKEILARLKSTANSRHPSISQLLHEWGIVDDPLVQAAYKVGGISRHPIYRIYLRVGTPYSFQKMSRLVEDQYLPQIIQILRCEPTA